MADPVLHAGIDCPQASYAHPAASLLLPPKGTGSGNTGLLYQFYMPPC